MSIWVMIGPDGTDQAEPAPAVSLVCKSRLDEPRRPKSVGLEPLRFLTPGEIPPVDRSDANKDICGFLSPAPVALQVATWLSF
jgi:hypothetical protein